MALEVMGYRRGVVADGYEILHNSEYVGSAITLDTTAFTSGVCLAGTPIDATGKKANTASAKGILLVDVYQERPQGTIVVGGYINQARAQAHSGVTLAAEAIAALKNVVLM